MEPVVVAPLANLEAQRKLCLSVPGGLLLSPDVPKARPWAINKAERGFRFPLSAHSLKPAKGAHRRPHWIPRRTEDVKFLIH